MASTQMDAFNQGSPLPALPALLSREPDEGARDGWGGPLGPETPPMTWHRRVRPGAKRPLARAIASEVVPLLVLAHRVPESRGTASEATAEAVRTLVALACRSDVPGAVTLIERLRASGLPFDDLYLDVIAGAARLLGQQWHDDEVSFADVTIGVLALQRLLHVLDPAFCGEPTRRHPQRRMLLAARPGETHGFALDLLSAFLRRAGWEVACLAPRDEQALCAAVKGGWYAVLGLSDSCGSGTEEMARVIHAARLASSNREIRVMLGGPAYSASPESAIRAGADATAADARHAVLQAEGLFALLRAGT